uniref:Uncharacterized protein n=2 Tax=Clastoptera arizonana TaxID=38151 RepID=A0A1B6E1U8_9HEMI
MCIWNRKEVIHLLPHHKVLADNFAPTHLTPRIVVAQQLSRKSKSPVQKTKFFTKKHSSDSGLCKHKKASSASRLRISRLSIGGRKKKKSEFEDSSLEMNSITTTPSTLDKTQDTVNLSDEYVRISKKEYESIKNRVSEIETRISHEFENIKGVSICSDLEVTPNASKTEIKDIQSAYERTLEQSEKLNNSSTDELARRLSRDLKIRRSMDSCIIRSPSARKIGTLRRKSKDNSPQLNRHMSLNTADRPRFRNSNFYPSKSLQRGKPNTIFTGLPQPNTITSEIILNQCFSSSMDSSFNKCEHNNETNYTDLSFGVLTRSQALKKSSLHGSDQANEITLSSFNHIRTAESPTLYNGEWENAEHFLSDMTNTESVEAVTGRPSIAKIRSQNAGMVLAKAKLFDSVIDHDKNNRDLTKKETVENMPMKKMIKPLETTCGNKLPKHHMSPRKSLIEHSESIQSPKVFKDKENKCEARLKTNNKSSNLINYCGSVVLPQGLKETIYDVCTPLYVKQRIVPLKDSNRDNSLPNTKKTPPIKKPLITPRSTHFSPFLSNESKVRKRPLKASVVITTPRRSPRQIAIKSRQTKY